MIVETFNSAEPAIYLQAPHFSEPPALNLLTSNQLFIA